MNQLADEVTVEEVSKVLNNELYLKFEPNVHKFCADSSQEYSQLWLE